LVKKASKIKLLSEIEIEIDGDFFSVGPAEIFVKKRAFLFKI